MMELEFHLTPLRRNLTLSYRVVFSKKARKQLKKLDKNTAKIIVTWIAKNLQGTKNPYFHGKALSAELIGLWRYRVLDYRLICSIDEEVVTINVLLLGHRKDSYKLSETYFEK